MLVLVMAGLLCGSARGMQGVRMAECRLENALKGTIKLHFTDKEGSATMMMGSISGLTAGSHGFHVHQEGDLGNKCANTGGHYNPLNVTHGGLNAAVRHQGDFGNIVANSDGMASISITKTGANLTAMISRAIVVHQLADDLGLGGAIDSSTTGAAGARLDCCTIQWTSASGPARTLSSFGILLPVLLAART